MLPKHRRKKSVEEKKPSAPLTIDTLQFAGDRKLMVINGYAFYTSSGVNSDMPGVLFPFRELEADGHLLKPSELYTLRGQQKKRVSAKDKQFKIGFPKDEKLQSLLKTSNLRLQRFGNIEAMLISLAFSEYAWLENTTLSKLRSYLLSKAVYKNYVIKLQETELCLAKPSEDYISRFQKKSSKLGEYDRERQEKHAADINKWLSDQGKIHDDPFPEYSNLMLERLEKPQLQVKVGEYNRYNPNRFFPGQQAYSKVDTVKFIFEIFKQIAIACVGNLIPFSFFEQYHSKNNNNYPSRNKK